MNVKPGLHQGSDLAKEWKGFSFLDGRLRLKFKNLAEQTEKSLDKQQMEGFMVCRTID